MTIVEWKLNQDSPAFRDVHALLTQLRMGLTLETFREILAESSQPTAGYRVYLSIEGHRPVGYMGGRVITDFVHGRHLYIDDLVVDRDARSKGVGAALLKKAEAWATAENCSGLRLCTGIENESAKRFYEREGWNLRAVAFKKKI